MKKALAFALLVFTATSGEKASAQQAPTEQLEALGYVGVPRFRVQRSKRRGACERSDVLHEWPSNVPCARCAWRSDVLRGKRDWRSNGRRGKRDRSG